jgi:Protein of unknown function (DUF616)
MRVIAYTVVVGDYDRLQAPLIVEPDIDYVAVTDSTSGSLPAPWRGMPLRHRDRNARMTARWHKLHPHILFPDHDVSLYLDGNICLKREIRGLVEQMSGIARMALFRHPERGCPYEEAEVIKRYRLDDPAIVDIQMAYYRRLGYPANRGLFAGSIQIRRHRDRELAAFLEDWWRQLKVFSQRDQLSLNFMLLRHRIEAAAIPGSLGENPWFATGPHRRHRVDLVKPGELGVGDEVDWLRMAAIESAADRASGRSAGDLAQWLRWRAMEPLRNAKRRLRWLTWRLPRLEESRVDDGGGISAAGRTGIPYWLRRS